MVCLSPSQHRLQASVQERMPVAPQCVDIFDVHARAVSGRARRSANSARNTFSSVSPVDRRLRDRQQRLEACAWLEGKPLAESAAVSLCERHLCVRIRFLQIAFCRSRGAFAPPRPPSRRREPSLELRQASCHPAAPGTPWPEPPAISSPDQPQGRSLPRPGGLARARDSTLPRRVHGSPDAA